MPHHPRARAVGSQRYVWFYEEGEWAQQGIPADWAAAIRSVIAAGRGSAATSSRRQPSSQATKPRPTTAKRPTTSRAKTQRPMQDLLDARQHEVESQTGVKVDWPKRLTR